MQRHVKMGNMILSDDAIVLGSCHFPTTGSTLEFGGDGSKMMITERGRKALEELVDGGFVEINEPQCVWPNREFYKGKKTVRHLMAERNLNPFNKDDERFNWSIFTKREGG